MTIVGASALALVFLTVTGNWAALRVGGQIELIQKHYMPKVQLGQTLEAELERLARLFQDAVAAQDLVALDETEALKRTLLAQLQSARSALSAEQFEALRNAILEYDGAAQDVSRRLIAGESGAALLTGISSMQAKQQRAASLLKSAMAFDRSELAAAFADVARAENDATKTRLLVSGTCLIVVILLSFWLTRGVLHSLAELGAGLDRFGRQEFGKAIDVDLSDEIGAIASQANQMAKSLARLSEQRDREDWLKAGHAQLVHELRGDLEPTEIANRASRVLADYLKAPAAVLHYVSNDDRLCVLGHHAALGALERDGVANSFRLGEGPIGAAARQEQIVLLDTPPDYLRIRTGLGMSAPSTVALVPLVQLGKVTGILELAFFRPWSEELAELLLSVRETLAI
ncbi:MAG TPA: GAF domain-containing protein, partial [Polyangiales bacterium]